VLPRLSPEQRLHIALERRLRSAPPALRAVATATSVSFEPPEFGLSSQQEAAAAAQLRCLGDARAAFRGRPDDGDEFDPEGGFPNPTRRFNGGDRVALMAEAIIGCDRASRVLRHWRLKLSVAIAEHSGVKRVELTLRPCLQPAR
jgi:hypothetical protein